jgi:DNA polymerase-3 subunit alpha
MAAQLNNTDGIDSLKIYMDEAKKIGITVLGPDINESFPKFTVNSKGEIRLGLSAIKNVGEGAAEEIINKRQESGFYTNIFDLCKRVNSRVLNKRVLEVLAYTGGFDCFVNTHRAQYFFKAEGETSNIIEKAMKYGAQIQASESANQASLFGGSVNTALPEPKIPTCDEWGLLEKLKKEEEFMGLYLSGHPLDNFAFELGAVCKHNLSYLSNLEEAKGNEFTMGGIITQARTGISKTGKPYGIIKVEDYTHNYEFAFFGKDYITFNAFFEKELAVYMRVKVQTREFPRDSTELECKVLEMKLLGDVKRDKLKEISIKIPVSSVDEEFLEIMRDTLAHKKDGWMSLRMQLLDELNQREISMISRSHKIDMDYEMWQKLQNTDLKVTFN